MKEVLISPLVLALPKSKGEYTLDTDICDIQIECVVLHKQQDGSNRAAGYWILTL